MLFLLAVHNVICAELLNDLQQHITDMSDHATLQNLHAGVEPGATSATSLQGHAQYLEQMSEADRELGRLICHPPRGPQCAKCPDVH